MTDKGYNANGIRRVYRKYTDKSSMLYRQLSHKMETSYISKKEILPGEEIPCKDIRAGVLSLLKSDFPDIYNDDYISIDELNQYRRLYLTSLVVQERGELAIIDEDVIAAIRNNSILSEDIQEELEAQLTIGQKLADSVARFGGSWIFIITFFSFILVWMIANIFVLSRQPFDPFPFILLNLLLSCLAAIQAPIIMMSQNRQEQKDRVRGEHDYKINLKAELEIKLLSEKIDHLLIHQSKKLLEIQEVQTDYLEDVLKELKKQ